MARAVVASTAGRFRLGSDRMVAVQRCNRAAVGMGVRSHRGTCSSAPIIHRQRAVLVFASEGEAVVEAGDDRQTIADIVKKLGKLADALEGESSTSSSSSSSSSDSSESESESSGSDSDAEMDKEGKAKKKGKEKKVKKMDKESSGSGSDSCSESSSSADESSASSQDEAELQPC